MVSEVLQLSERRVSELGTKTSDEPFNSPTQMFTLHCTYICLTLSS